MPILRLVPYLRLALVLLCLPFTAFALDANLESFTLKWNEDVVRHPVLAVYALPGEKVTLEILPTKESDGTFLISRDAGELDEETPTKFSWIAPARPGFYPIVVASEATGEEAHLNVFVLVPFSKVKRGWLNRFKIGNYPVKPGMIPPRGFIEVTPAIENVAVSPRFTLKQFLCKQAGGHPKYLVLHPYLPRRLESIIDSLGNAGINVETLEIMSAFRTPAYNRRLRTARFSRHQWGEAADIVVPDVDGDGYVSKEDLEVVFKVIDDLQNSDDDEIPTGGLGKYRANRRHGRFLHVDVRGYEARWNG